MCVRKPGRNSHPQAQEPLTGENLGQRARSTLTMAQPHRGAQHYRTAAPKAAPAATVQVPQGPETVRLSLLLAPLALLRLQSGQQRTAPVSAVPLRGRGKGTPLRRQSSGDAWA